MTLRVFIYLQDGKTIDMAAIDRAKYFQKKQLATFSQSGNR